MCNKTIATASIKRKIANIGTFLKLIDIKESVTIIDVSAELDISESLCSTAAYFLHRNNIGEFTSGVFTKLKDFDGMLTVEDKNIKFK